MHNLRIHKLEILIHTQERVMWFFVKPNSLYIFCPYVVNGWNKREPKILSSSDYNIFCNSFLKFIRSGKWKILKINDPFGIKMLIKLTLFSSHFYESNFKNCFEDIKFTFFMQY